ncbi:MULTISPECIES: hypothetical protein [Planococcus]|uniref:Uncharacterized protein n=1 Tax=Planococcus kocurii TaxID=1374 RepID=A0ABM5WSM5_9BACL|nr:MULTISPECIES: hypothetical protein [Planococcus]ALS77287.1 hypothetical protein AUO94_00900 [Planococcus kocurii]KAA0956188.1 hypothetical protein FQ085_13800 [Planococcus sp. ANT_H30]MDJ0332231.1 hypothetical protein [Planococcus sp. S3-L1]
MKKKRNVLGYLSIITALTSVIFFFSPIDNEIDAIIIGLISLLGIGFALASKELWYVFIGTISNMAMLGMAYLLIIGTDFSKL